VRTDEELMAAYVAGDKGAFRTLFERHAPALERVMQRDLAEREEARDLVQQAFLQLHRARLDFDPKQRLKPWLYTIALNLKREHFRKRRRRPESPDSDQADRQPTPPRGQEQTEARRSVTWALERIPTEQREVIELHWLAGLSFPELAESMGISVAAAKVRAHRGYLRLRELLADGAVPAAGQRIAEGAP
jgi:RNA polymerase sigma factor (sigma-70 family)